MDSVKEAMIEGCRYCDFENGEMIEDGCGIMCTACGMHRCLGGE